LVFLDPPKPDAAAALARLAALGITVRIVTGDNPVVAAKVCHDLCLPAGKVLTGRDIDALDDTHLAAAIPSTTVFARVSPEHKARIVRLQRLTGADVAFLGDGVNDALALHAADVGISVDSATDVAKDAADVILLKGSRRARRRRRRGPAYLRQHHQVRADGYVQQLRQHVQRRWGVAVPDVPADAAVADLAQQPAVRHQPTGHPHRQRRRGTATPPSHWDTRFIRRFMLYFGPFSSVFDSATFAIMLWVFHSGPAQFRTGWFVESLATQTLVIFAIRTRRIPFFRSHPSLPLTLAALGVVSVGALLPATRLANVLGFHPLPGGFFAALAVMVACYLTLIEVGKRLFYGAAPTPAAATPRPVGHGHLRRRAAYFTTGHRP
jgi:P-type Mg2+ transporter